MKVKEKSSWEDDSWKKDFSTISEELGISEEEKKPKKPLLIRLKILSDQTYIEINTKKRWYKHKNYLTKFGKTLKYSIISLPIIGLSVFGGIKQWAN